MQDRKGVREAWSEWWRQGEWAGTVDGTESPTSELPRKVDLEGRSKSRSLQQSYGAHSLEDPGHSGEAGSYQGSGHDL